MRDYEILTVNSLEKVFPDKKPKMISNTGTCLKNERYSYQIAIKNNKKDFFKNFPEIKIESDIKDFIKLRTVENTICQTPIRNTSDDYYLTKKSIIMPEILKDDEPLILRLKEWNSLFVTINGDLKPGEHKIIISFIDKDDNTLIGASEFSLTVLDKELLETDLHYTNWFHYDSLSSYYNEEIFSKRYNEIMFNFIKNAVNHEMDTLLVPHITPALDTKIGGERITTQLVDINYINGIYSFKFDRLISFMFKAKELGIKRFEMAHLFTQWGAVKTPKIMINDGKELKNMFGWNIESLDDKYINFLKEYLPELTDSLQENGFSDTEVIFHLSDEPNTNSLERYLKLRNIVKPLIKKYKITDALSNYDFYKLGAVDEPIVCISHYNDFYMNGYKNAFVYHCCSECDNRLPNRFMSLPLSRVRVIGILLYSTESKGLLQWGYNFYNSSLTKRYINPYEINDADGTFQSGDSFIVYPKEDGGIYDSIRHEALYDGFQDYRLLKTLGSIKGKEYVFKLLDEFGFKHSFTDYPIGNEAILNLRQKIHELIKNTSK